MEFGQTLSVVIEQKVFGFRLEQAKLARAVTSTVSELSLCQEGRQQVSREGEQESTRLKKAKDISSLQDRPWGTAG